MRAPRNTNWHTYLAFTANPVSNAPTRMSVSLAWAAPGPRTNSPPQNTAFAVLPNDILFLHQGDQLQHQHTGLSTASSCEQAQQRRYAAVPWMGPACFQHSFVFRGESGMCYKTIPQGHRRPNGGNSITHSITQRHMQLPRIGMLTNALHAQCRVGVSLSPPRSPRCFQAIRKSEDCRSFPRTQGALPYSGLCCSTQSSGKPHVARNRVAMSFHSRLWVNA